MRSKVRLEPEVIRYVKELCGQGRILSEICGRPSQASLSGLRQFLYIYFSIIYYNIK